MKADFPAQRNNFGIIDCIYHYHNMWYTGVNTAYRDSAIFQLKGTISLKIGWIRHFYFYHVICHLGQDDTAKGFKGHFIPCNIV